MARALPLLLLALLALCEPAYASTLAVNATTFLRAHNALRARHGAPALAWNTTLAAGAQSWANACVFAHSTPNGAYGENLYAASPLPSTVNPLESSATAAWYNEASVYNYAAPGFSPATGHFTQVVWKASRALGCGVTNCGARAGILPGYVVCRYAPPGNYIGAFAANVLPPRAVTAG